MQVRVVRISKAALVSWKHCRFQRQTAGPSDKVDVCLLPAGPFSGAALVGQGAQANSLRSSFSVLEFKLWKINILQYTLALQYCVHTLSISRRQETYFLTYKIVHYMNIQIHFFVRQKKLSINLF